MTEAIQTTSYLRWGFWSTALQTGLFSISMAVLVSIYMGQGIVSDEESVFLVVGLWTNTALILAAIIVAHYLLLQRTLDFVESGRVEMSAREVLEEIRRYPRRYTWIVFGNLVAVLFSLSFIILILASFFVKVSWTLPLYVFVGWMLLSLPPAYLQYSTAERWAFDIEARLQTDSEPPMEFMIPVTLRLGLAFAAVLLVTLTVASHLLIFQWSPGAIVAQTAFLGGFVLLVIQKTSHALLKQHQMMRVMLAPFETEKEALDDTRALWSAIREARQQLELWRRHRRDSEVMIREQVQRVALLLGSERIASTDSGLTAIMSSINALATGQQRLYDEIEDLRSWIADGIAKMGKGMTLLEQSAESIQTVHDEALASSRRAVDLSMHMAQIEDVIRIIAYVTDQTRILAFNASIETAGAGELGERFGVVAKEIRQLAQNIGNSAETINRIVHDVRKATHISVMAVEKELKHAVDALQKAEEAQISFADADQVIGETVRAASQAHENVTEQQRIQGSVLTTMRDTEGRLRELLGRQNELSVAFSKLKENFEKWSASGS